MSIPPAGLSRSPLHAVKGGGAALGPHVRVCVSTCGRRSGHAQICAISPTVNPLTRPPLVPSVRHSARPVHNARPPSPQAQGKAPAQAPPHQRDHTPPPLPLVPFGGPCWHRAPGGQPRRPQAPDQWTLSGGVCEEGGHPLPRPRVMGCLMETLVGRPKGGPVPPVPMQRPRPCALGAACLVSWPMYIWGGGRHVKEGSSPQRPWAMEREGGRAGQGRPVGLLPPPPPPRG